MQKKDKRRFGLIGSGISHSLSPKLFLEAHGEDCAYDLLDVDDFEEAWAAFAEGPYEAVNVTAPFKVSAAQRCEVRSPEAEQCGAANIVVKSGNIFHAYNSDVLGVRKIVSALKGVRSVTVIGGGGAGRAALCACRSLGLEPALLHHDDELEVKSDLIIYTLPRRVECSLDCAHLLEANYKDPCFTGHPGYISGLKWLRAQAEEGYGIMYYR